MAVVRVGDEPLTAPAAAIEASLTAAAAAIEASAAAAAAERETREEAARQVARLEAATGLPQESLPKRMG